MKNPSCILTSDWHIRPDTPRCRTDNFITTMWDKVEFIFQLSADYEAPILLAGDLGHRPQWPNWLLEQFISLINKYKVRIISIAGQHDLPNHNIVLKEKSGYGVLVEGKHILEAIKPLPPPINMPIDAFEFGSTIQHSEKKMSHVAMSHQLVVKDKLDWPGQVADRATALLKKFPEYKLILTGDNHVPFTASYQKRILVNPGSLMRQNADQIDHRPRVYLWQADSNEIEAVYIPIIEGVVDRTHLEGFLAPQQRDERVAAYVDRLNQSYELSLKYEDNLEHHMQENKTNKAVQERVWWALEEKK